MTAAQLLPVSNASAASFSYRADGMRVEKILHSGVYTMLGLGGGSGGELDDVYSRYRYDGQMPMETFVTKADSSTVLTENGLGARGIDYSSVTNSSGTNVLFPIYDAHGNEVTSLSRSGSSYSLSNQRSYGAWGEVRQGATTGGPRGRYCGNLGHVQDDETGLIYMRARYYESTSGRFISEDPSLDGRNYFDYANCDPVGFGDKTGKNPSPSQLFWTTLALGMGVVGAGFGVNFAGLAAFCSNLILGGASILLRLGPVGARLATTIVDAASQAAMDGIAAIAVIACAAYAMVCGVLALFDDTWSMNEAVGYGSHQGVQFPWGGGPEEVAH